jgi:hypothetical protein
MQPKPTTTTIDTARFAVLIGSSAQLVYRTLTEAPEKLPVQPIQLGRRLRWPVVPVARLTGLPVEFVASDCEPTIEALAAAVALHATGHSDAG